MISNYTFTHVFKKNCKITISLYLNNTLKAEIFIDILNPMDIKTTENSINNSIKDYERSLIDDEVVKVCSEYITMFLQMVMTQ